MAYAVFALIVSQTAGAAPPMMTIILALVVGLFVELANRVLARPALRPFVVKDLFSDDTELRHRHTILNRAYLIGLIGVALLSYLLSGVGSSYYADDANGEPPQINEDSIKQVTLLAENKANEQFAADTAMTAQPYNIRLSAAHQKFLADSSALMKERQRYKGCANEGNKYCKGKLTIYLGKIDQRRAVMADSISSIAAQKAVVLSAILADRKSSLQDVIKAGNTELNRARDDNQKTRTDHENKSSFQGLIFIILTVAGQTVFYYMVYLTLQVEAGSEIEYNLEPNEFWSLPGTAAEYFTGLSWRSERFARSVIRKLYTPRKERQTDIPYKGLFDNASEEQGEDTQETEEERTQRKQRCEDARARERKPLDDDNATTQDDVYYNALTTEPKTKAEIMASRQRKRGEVGNIEQCDHCGNDYTRKTTRQRFCSTDCRLNHHAAKHNGKRFDEIITKK